MIFNEALREQQVVRAIRAKTQLAIVAGFRMLLRHFEGGGLKRGTQGNSEAQELD